MSNQKAVCQIFNLPPNEKIFDDFGCSFSDKIMYPGRMFITENYICFNSSIIGLSQNIKLKIKEIIDISINKYLMKTWIEISTTEKVNNSEKLSFTSFNNAELVLKKILKIKKHLDKRLGKLNNKGLSSSEESDDDIIESKRNTISYLSNSNTNMNTNLGNKNSKSPFSSREENIVNISNDLSLNDSLKEDKKEYFSMDNEQNYLQMLDTEKFYELPLIVINMSINEAFKKIYLEKGKLSNYDFTEESPIKSNIKCSNWYVYSDNNGDYVKHLANLVNNSNSDKTSIKDNSIDGNSSSDYFNNSINKERKIEGDINISKTNNQ